MTDFDSVEQEELAALAEAAREVKLCMRVLTKTGDTVLTELFRGIGPGVRGIEDWQHYPADDVYDAEFHAQYYYHAHPVTERVEDEAGHFHTFLRPLGMPDGVAPLPLPDLAPDPDGNGALSHLVGISVDRFGQPIRLFTTNRWVTGETWYGASDVVRMLDGFVIDHARPSWPLNRWLTALVRLYRPAVVDLLHRRDATVARWQSANPGINVFEDRRLEVTSEMQISLDEYIGHVEQAMRRLRRRLRAQQAFA